MWITGEEKQFPPEVGAPSVSEGPSGSSSEMH